MKKVLLAVFCIGLLSACGNDLSGNVYTTLGGRLEMTFEDDGYVEIMGVRQPYKVDGDKVIVGNEGAEQLVMKILDNGNIDAPMGMFIPKE